MSNYGSTGHNLLAGAPAEAYDDPDYWRQFMSGGGTKSEGQWTRHMDEFDRVHAQQLRAAEAYYGGAGRPADVQAAQHRGQALRAAAVGLGAGGTAARDAIYGMGEGSYQAGAQGAGEALQSRLQASDAYMSAQSDRAIYDQSVLEAFKRRDAAARARDQAIEEARAGGEWREQAAAMGAAGAAVGAGASGLAASKGWGDEQEQQGKSKYGTEGV